MKMLLFMMLGVLFFLITRYNKAAVRQDFSWRIFFKKQWGPVALNLLGGVIIIFGFGINEGAFVFNDKDVTLLVAAALGVLGEVVFTSVVEGVNKKVKTKFGFN